jgi:hypothetical protein
VKLTSLGAIVLLAACAHRGPATAECDRFTGSYVLEPASCHESRGLLQLPLEQTMAKWPNESIIEPTPTLVGIHQEGCDSLSFVFRERHGFAVNVVDGEARWENGALTHTQRGWSNLPPPIAIGAHGDSYWSLRRKPGSDDLLYTVGYSERGLFFLIPFHAHHETTCTLTRQR